jgi:hypothetical protein
MAGRHVVGLTNSEKAADVIATVVSEDFPDSVQRRVTHVEGYGVCVEISVDADDFERWVVR